MKLSTFFIFILAIGLSIAVYQFFRIQETNTVGKNLVTRTRPFSAHPSQPTKKILILGDSLAVGVGSSDPVHSIAGRIGQDYPRADITNVAVSGARVRDLENQITPYTQDHFDLILIQIGANDVTHFTRLHDVQNTMNRLIKIAQDMAPNVLVYSSGSVGFAPVFIPPLSSLYTLQTKRVHRVLSDTVTSAEETYVDLYVPYRYDIFHTDINRYYAADKFHVTGDAYNVWYEKIQPVITRLFSTSLE